MERGAVIAPSDCQPIVAADAGPPIRLAAAGILDTLRGLDRRIVRADRGEDEGVVGLAGAAPRARPRTPFRRSSPSPAATTLSRP